MAEDTRDILMKIEIGGVAIPAECQAVLPGTDPLGKDGGPDPLAGGFITASPLNKWKGNYFGIETFTFEVGVHESGAGGAGGGKAGGSQTPPKMDDAFKRQLVRDPASGRLFHAKSETYYDNNYNQVDRSGKPVKGGGGGGGSAEFSRFLAGGRSATRGRSYSAELEPVAISKLLDMSSLTLFKACINSTTLNSATMLKRRGGGGRTLRTYLRIDFTDLLITDFDWSEDDVIKEKFKFVCRKAEVQYSVEKNDGTLDKAAPKRTWSVLNMK